MQCLLCINKTSKICNTFFIFLDSRREIIDKKKIVIGILNVL